MCNDLSLANIISTEQESGVNNQIVSRKINPTQWHDLLRFEIISNPGVGPHSFLLSVGLALSVLGLIATPQVASKWLKCRPHDFGLCLPAAHSLGLWLS